MWDMDSWTGNSGMIQELYAWKNKYPLCGTGRSGRSGSIFFDRCFFYLPYKVLLPVRNLLTEDGEVVCLIKPQFEAGREKVGKKGVVRDPKVHEEVIEKVRDYAMSIFMEPCHLSFSPIKGPEGNIEYLLHLKKHPEGTEVPVSLDVSVEDVVKEAHGQLD